METFSLRQMEELLAEHEMAEFEMDIDRTMATLVENPVYELPTLGWYIEGQTAVRAAYERLLVAGEKMNLWADKRVHAVNETTLCREAYVYFDTPEGRRTGRYMTVIVFEGNRILGERMYMDDAYTKAMEGVLGDDFAAVPGVSRLADKTPPPVPRLDRAREHAANRNH
ncbi:hypothetical protein HZZ00_25560 [Streptomyces sp. NEAU-sy36]|uniref:hypothetical protein n=1 Tax=unclassified Streptomyces TaxID=2593676 RepID=UPI0015D5F1EA|nr:MULTISPECIES: hypothetical protein [unclassified Streptomyces]QLJ04029.1 hypothetical protein HZZ00_25560 [Streptomyces sp. NEAU-sy36]